MKTMGCHRRVFTVIVMLAGATTTTIGMNVSNGACNGTVRQCIENAAAGGMAGREEYLMESQVSHRILQGFNSMEKTVFTALITPPACDARLPYNRDTKTREELCMERANLPNGRRTMELYPRNIRGTNTQMS
ncbi:hypothetical protein QQ045_013817 [Rhodiola kirilowii]